MATSRLPRFQVGDRVRERDRIADSVITPRSPNYQQVTSILSQRRHGLVVGFVTKRSSNGRCIHYTQVQWDHLSTPSLHAVARIEKVAA
jgi:ribosomal protein L19